MQQFLNDVLELPELRRSYALEKFLMEPNYEEFDRNQKKLIEGLVGKKDIRTLVTKRNIEDGALQDYPIEAFRNRAGYVPYCDFR